jgi:hypothetical protein
VREHAKGDTSPLGRGSEEWVSEARGMRHFPSRVGREERASALNTHAGEGTQSMKMERTPRYGADNREVVGQSSENGRECNGTGWSG